MLSLSLQLQARLILPAPPIEASDPFLLRLMDWDGVRTYRLPFIVKR